MVIQGDGRHASRLLLLLLLELGFEFAHGRLEAGRLVVAPEAHADRAIVDKAPRPALDDGDDALVPLMSSSGFGPATASSAASSLRVVVVHEGRLTVREWAGNLLAGIDSAKRRL
jgi:hypothetical protein